VPNVEIIGPGLRGKDLSSKLASREMTEFLESVEREFDHVIIDSVPSLLMSDAKLLAPIVDGVLVVIGVGVSTRGMVSRCLNEMGQVNAEVIGIVVNGIRPTRGGYLRRNLDMYYRYSDETENKVSYEDISDIPEIKIVDAAADEEPEPIILLTASSEESDGEKTEQT
jgi:Mrp family chromosome partitioning ATPase